MAAVHTSKLTIPAPVLCANCSTPLGASVGIVPFCINDDDGRGGGKRESWCPQCFCGVRAALDPERFPRMADGRMLYSPIKCAADECGLSSVAIGFNGSGMVACGQCGSRHVLTLPVTRAKVVLSAATRWRSE